MRAPRRPAVAEGRNHCRAREPICLTRALVLEARMPQHARRGRVVLKHVGDKLPPPGSSGMANQTAHGLAGVAGVPERRRHPVADLGHPGFPRLQPDHADESVLIVGAGIDRPGELGRPRGQDAFDEGLGRARRIGMRDHRCRPGDTLVAGIERDHRRVAPAQPAQSQSSVTISGWVRVSSAMADHLSERFPIGCAQPITRKSRQKDLKRTEAGAAAGLRETPGPDGCATQRPRPAAAPRYRCGP